MTYLEEAAEQLRKARDANEARSGSVSNQNNGCASMGCQSQPATFAVSGRLASVAPWLNVNT